MHLAIDKYNKRGKHILILEEDIPALRITTNRAQCMDMIQTILVLRPEIRTLILDQWLEPAVTN